MVLTAPTATAATPTVTQDHQRHPSSGDGRCGIVPPSCTVRLTVPVAVVAPDGRTYDKLVSNIQEAKARGARVIAVATEGDEVIRQKADDVIYVPDTLECLQPLLTVIPLQLLAYHIAVLRGCDVDKPRNLAKSVTVE